MPNMSDSSANVLHLEAYGLLDPQARSREESIKRPKRLFGLGDDCGHLRRRKSGFLLLSDLRQIHEIVIPFHWIDRLTFVTQGRSHHHLNNLHIVCDGLRSETSLSILFFLCHR
jgi:hypothetical protein